MLLSGEGAGMDANISSTLTNLATSSVLAHAATPFYERVIDFLNNTMNPIMTSVQVISRFVGIFMVMVGIIRLKRHSHHEMMHRISPAGTLFMFISGGVLVMFTPELFIFGNSVFGHHFFLGGHEWNSVVNTQCVYGGQGHFCPMLGYARIVEHSTDIQKSTLDLLKLIAFSILFLVGSISFLRGFILLTKVGEGSMSGGAHLPKTLTHIIAGTIGVNAPIVYNFFSSVTIF